MNCKEQSKVLKGEIEDTAHHQQIDIHETAAYHQQVTKKHHQKDIIEKKRNTSTPQKSEIKNTPVSLTRNNNSCQLCQSM